MAKIKNTPNAEQRTKFNEFLEYWQLKLGLLDWRIVLIEKPAIAAMASVSFYDEDRMAVVRLGDFGADTIDDTTLSTTACHELLHVLLHDLATGNADKDSYTREHRVINVLERLLIANG